MQRSDETSGQEWKTLTPGEKDVHMDWNGAQIRDKGLQATLIDIIGLWNHR
jgi:hypothetical protein